MSYIPLSHVAVGDLATAALHNILLDDIAIIKTFISDIGQWAGDIKNFNELCPTLTPVGGAVPIDCSAQNAIIINLNADLSSPTFTNVPASGKEYSLEIWLIPNGTAHTWAWLTGTVAWDGNSPPPLVSTSGHAMRFLVSTVDGGSHWKGVIIGSNYFAWP